MKLQEKHVALLILFVFALGIGGAMLSGYWQSDPVKRPAWIQERNFKGMLNPADIRGSDSFADVSDAFDIPPECLLQAFGLKGHDPSEIKLKDLKTFYADRNHQIGRQSVQYFVTLWTDIPTDQNRAKLLPEAEAVLFKNGKISPEEKIALQNHNKMSNTKTQRQPCTAAPGDGNLIRTPGNQRQDHIPRND